MPKKIKAVGSIKITDGDNVVTYSATYDAADVLDALRAGESIQSVIARLEDVEQDDSEPAADDYLAIESDRNAFPYGM